ncbi:hypothetical protein N7528_008230 [Penicillium herquei]|nr:hypothetical protein N7528_008230 [Penicillium herquei]
MTTCLESSDLYTIAWVAALAIEQAAALALLDDRHSPPKGFIQPLSDTNSYEWGRVGAHNIVIASLPAGLYGNTSTAITVLALVHTFPHIRIGLLVGIGEGIARPDLGQDVRLGDIVVSQPDGTSGGVIQYDFGKAKSNGGWERKGSLDKPPIVLLSALTRLQAQHEISPSKIPTLLQRMLKANPRMKRQKTDYRHQGTATDRLFKSQHDHISGVSCNMCDSTWEIKWEGRETTEPKVHYGIIASGNKLIKDAATRDKLSEDTGHQCLCIEMEAAGLMNYFPCLVIRGICDYADSHNNDRWQRYAAAVAAAFAVELLGYVPMSDLKRTRTVTEALQGLEQRVNQINTSVRNLDHNMVLDRLKISEGASFDSRTEEKHSTCLKDTRVQLLDDIYRWIDDSHSESKPIFWSNGMAGTGKSTISRTVARTCDQQDRLGASFFFKRGEIDRVNLVKFVPTLAHQLVHRVTGFAQIIKAILDCNPEILNKAIRRQFSDLIWGPLTKIAASRTTILSLTFVIDALDECEHEDDIKLLLDILSEIPSMDSLCIRVFVTGRPETSVYRHLPSHAGICQTPELHKISPELVHSDISLFLRHELTKIRDNFNNSKQQKKLPHLWPAETVIQQLTDMASPLFIFAATICRFIDNWRMGDPDELLKQVTRNETIESFKLITGTIITLVEPLSSKALAGLLDLRLEKVTVRLRNLPSVLDVPENINSPVRLLHQSFREYLIAEEIDFGIDEKLAHQTIATKCFDAMTALKENTCSLRYPGTCRSEIDRENIEKCIPSELQYACLHWVHHQINSKHGAREDQKITKFLQDHLLHWIEVLALMGQSGNILTNLKPLANWLEIMNFWDSLAFVKDAIRFSTMNIAIVDEAPLQIYSSALVFAPRQSLIRQSFERSIPSWLSLRPQVKEIWDSCLLIIDTQDYVEFFIVSHNSTKIASAFGLNETIRIWDTNTGSLEHALEGRSDFGVTVSLAFSHDLRFLALLGYGRTVRIWDVQMGRCKQVLRGHRSSVNSVTFLHDSKTLASASSDNTIRIWDVQTGKCDQVLKGHEGNVMTVVFSPGLDKIFSASYDHSIRIWNAQTGICEQILEGVDNWATSMVFSHDFTMVTSPSKDHIIRIRNMQTGQCEHELESSDLSTDAGSVAFSPDSKLLASAHTDGMIRIWNTKTWNCEQILKGHSSKVTSVIFSHDSELLISGSMDQTIRVWGIHNESSEQVIESYDITGISSMVFSNDSSMLASASCGNSVLHIWNAQTGICEQEIHTGDWVRVRDDCFTLMFSHDSEMLLYARVDGLYIWNIRQGSGHRLKGYRQTIESVVLSHDSKLLASGSDSLVKTVRIWNTQTGNCEAVLEGHGDSIRSVAFSHDSQKMASASEDKTIRIWNTRTGKCEQVLESRNPPFCPHVLFSYDSSRIAWYFDKSVWVRDLQTGTEQSLEGYSERITSMVFSHDTQMIASVSRDMKARIWNAETGECLQVLAVDPSSGSYRYCEPYN